MIYKKMPVGKLKSTFVEGTKVHVSKIDESGLYRRYENKEATVVSVDGIGTIHVKYNDGYHIGLLPHRDEFEIVETK